MRQLQSPPWRLHAIAWVYPSTQGAPAGSQSYPCNRMDSGVRFGSSWASLTESMRSAGKLEEIAVAVRARRRALGVTQIALAQLAGVGADFVYDVEQGKPTLRLDKLLDVLEVLGLQLRIESGKKRLVSDLAPAKKP